ncbi:FecR family protein [Mangrovibacterium diazotrophicum]|uniref:FecR family protein n=1 Tax=Mangrovibacterium diazotrophicum TaxID=1261403 RepID=A0A419W639_9BACT|nr:FecR domain-containing protein [Mangrovibacterium diazotrophicum]RKD90915.1 FecR family protein [Mangrovibacterium diazotrophicum]
MKLEILIQYIEGSSDESVKTRVEEWLAKDESNSDYLTKVTKVWSNIDELKALAAIDVDTDWAFIEKRISAKKVADSGTAVVRKMWWATPMLKIAASLLILVALGSAIWYMLGNKPTTTEMAQNFYEFNVPMGQKSSLTLPDGTKIMVNAGSTLRLPKQDMVGKREIWLEGEAFFEVTKNPSNPFYVNTPNIEVKVLGTSFNVRAYKDEHLVETTLVEGKVNLTNRYREEDEVNLTPNHKAILLLDKDVKLSASVGRDYSQNLRLGRIQVSDEIDPQNAISWTKGKLVFKEENFEFIAEQLARFYGVRIHIEDESLKSNKYSGTIKNISLEQALKALQMISEFQFVIKDDEVFIKK